jgi:hypothetical protein
MSTGQSGKNFLALSKAAKALLGLIFRTEARPSIHACMVGLDFHGVAMVIVPSRQQAVAPRC